MTSKSIQLKRLWSLALLLVLMCLPQMAWAETGNWTLQGVNYGICAVGNNKSISANAMGSTSSWGSYSITSRNDLGAVGCQGTEFAGTTTKSDEKFISISRYKQTYAVPSYAKLVRTSLFKVCMASARYRHGAGLYIFDTDNEAYTTSLDAMPYQDQATLSECIIKATDHDGTHTWSQNSRSITFDNSTSAKDATFEKFAAFMHVTCSYGSPNTKGNEWAGFIEDSYTDTYIYYATITFDANGGTGSMANQTIENSGTLTASSFSRDDYIFMGWNTKADGSGTSYADAAGFAATSTNKGPVTLYAQWTPCPAITFTFDANGGTGTMAQQKIAGSGTLNANTFARSNYLFTGWNTAADGSGTAYAAGANITVTEENEGTLTLYAQWTPTITITFDANGGSGTMAQQVITGSGTLTANTFARSNYLFTGWNTAADGSGTAYAAGADITVTEENKGPLTLYAQWTPIIFITFNANGGLGTMTQQKIIGSGTLVANAFTLAGGTFKDWNTEPDGSGTAYDDKAVITPSESENGPITLYAQWEVDKIIITFNANNGTGTMDNQEADGMITLNANSFTRDKYVFLGWNTKPDGTGISYNDGETINFAGQANKVINLYAQWIYNSLTVTFNANGGQGEMSEQTIDASGKLNANAFTCRGCVFLGWNTEADGSGTSYANAEKLTLSETLNGEMTLYAQWKVVVTDDMPTLVLGENGPFAIPKFSNINFNYKDASDYTLLKFVAPKTGRCQFTQKSGPYADIAFFNENLSYLTETIGNDGYYLDVIKDEVIYLGVRPIESGNYEFFVNVVELPIHSTENGVCSKCNETVVTINTRETIDDGYYKSSYTKGFVSLAFTSGWGDDSHGGEVTDGQPLNISVTGNLIKTVRLFSDYGDIGAAVPSAGTNIGTMGTEVAYILNVNSSKVSITGDAQVYKVQVTYVQNQNATGCQHTLLHHTPHSSTCSTKGNLEYWSCSECGNYFSDSQGKTAIAQSSWLQDYNLSNHTNLRYESLGDYDMSHHVTCGDCGEDIGYPDCTYDGYFEVDQYEHAQSCIYCGGWNKGDHDSSYREIAATCTEPGYKQFYCSKCEYIFSDEEIKPLGHDFTGHILTATPDANGLYSYVCAHDANHILENTKVIKGYTSNGNLELSVDDEGKYSSIESINQTDANEYKAVKVQFTAPTNPTYSRSMSNEWGTVVVPFAITYDASNTNYKLYKLLAFTGSALSFTEFEDGASIPIGMPMVVQAIGEKNSNGKYEIVLTASDNVVNTAIARPDAVNGLAIRGTYTTTTVAADAGYVLNGSQFVKATEATEVAPFHAYLAGSIDGVITIDLSEPASPGDLNGDGVITIADLTRLVEILNGRATDTNGTADVDGNGSITTEDANALRNKILEVK